MKVGKLVIRFCYLMTFVVTLALLSATAARTQQYPMLDKIAEHVVQKYQTSTCEQLWQKKSEPKSKMEQEAVQKLRENPGMRQEFINRVAAPIANKLFECGMLP